MRRFQREAVEANNNNRGAADNNAAAANDAVDMEYVKMSKEDITNMEAEDTANNEDDEWLDYNESDAFGAGITSNAANNSANSSSEAQRWASAVIARISNENVKVETALGALGLVLHSALLELKCGVSSTSSSSNGGGASGSSLVRCTGVPDQDVLQELSLSRDKGGQSSSITSNLHTKKQGNNGFALPVRELPSDTLVPRQWEKECTSSSLTPLVAFRYKKDRGGYSSSSINTNNSSNSNNNDVKLDASTLYLIVESAQDEDQINVYFGPYSTNSNTDNQHHSKRMTIQLDTYVNLQGIHAALDKSSPASPVLFYKSLKELLLSFSASFGLEGVRRCTFGEVEKGVGGATGTAQDVNMAAAAAGVEPMPSQTTIATGPAMNKPSVNPLQVLDTVHTGRRGRGDFEGDLLPGGPMPGPDIPNRPHLGGGNQVGPNHPMFDRTFDDYDGNHHYGDDNLGYDDIGPRFRVPGTGGFEMRPRFDPFGPPGGPMEPGRSGRGRGGGRGGRGGGRGSGGLPGGLGFPNPDHLRPPNNDYFS